jgi:hypothetical protein
MGKKLVVQQINLSSYTLAKLQAWAVPETYNVAESDQRHTATAFAFGSPSNLLLRFRKMCKFSWLKSKPVFLHGPHHVSKK